MKRLLPSAAFALTMSLVGAASAQDAAPACPPGSWFCADAPPPQAAPKAQELQPLPSPEAKPPAATPQAAPPPAPPPVVVYQPPPPIMVVQPRSDIPPRYDYTPREASASRPREVGLNFRLSGALMGNRAPRSAGMGGLGLGLRLKPNPHLGIEGAIDLLGGRDFNANIRNETSLSLTGLLYVNPKSKTQLYFLGGIGWQNARVLGDSQPRYGERTSYSYFGGHAGIGLEFRIARHFALNADIRGFVRGRTDDRANYQAEFRDANGRTTNTSGGGLVTGGMTFYF